MKYLEYYHWMANDWFITHQSLHKNKREKKHQGGEGNGLNPVPIFTGIRWFWTYVFASRDIKPSQE